VSIRRLSVQEEIDIAFAESERQCRLRAIEYERRRSPALPPTDAVLEMAAIGASIPAVSPPIDVMRERPAEPLPPPEPPKFVTDFYCGDCGKLFSASQYKSAGMAKMQRTKHMKKAHPRDDAKS
jgi:hypothetical protein